MIKLYYEDLDEVAEKISKQYGISEEKANAILFDYCDSEETKNYPENYDELLNAEIKEIADCEEIDENIVRAIISDLDLTDTLVDARLFKIKQGWVK